jgi:hypothetical protein
LPANVIPYNIMNCGHKVPIEWRGFGKQDKNPD